MGDRILMCKYNVKSIIAVFVVLIFLIYVPLSVEAQSTTYYEDEVAVLMYHHIDPSFKSSATIDPELFEAQLMYLIDAGYNFISMSQLESFIYEDGDIPENSILITFDDGYRSYYEYAYPILKKYNIPSTNFLIGEWIDKENGLSRLTSDDMIELSKDSLVDLQSHTFGLHKKTEELEPYLVASLFNEDGYETRDDYINRIKSDLTKNKNIIEQITTKEVYSFAYPYGAFNSDSISLLKETEHRLAFTIYNAMANKYINPFLLPRINAGNPEITAEQLHENILALNPEIKSAFNENIISGPDIYFKNKLIEFPEEQPFIKDNLTFVPVRAISEEFGARVYWDSDLQKVVICSAKNELIELEEKNRNIKIGEKDILLEAEPILYNGNLMVPIRFINSVFEAYIEWDGLNKRINIY